MAIAEGDLKSEAVKELFCRKPELEVDWRGPDTQYAGTAATYFFRVRNPGTAAADDVAVKVNLPPGADFVSASEGHVYDNAKREVAWRVGSLGPGDDCYMELRCTVSTPGENKIADHRRHGRRRPRRQQAGRHQRRGHRRPQARRQRSVRADRRRPGSGLRDSRHQSRRERRRGSQRRRPLLRRPRAGNGRRRTVHRLRRPRGLPHDQQAAGRAGHRAADPRQGHRSRARTCSAPKCSAAIWRSSSPPRRPRGSTKTKSRATSRRSARRRPSVQVTKLPRTSVGSRRVFAEASC